MAEKEYRRLTRSRSRSRFAIASTARTSLWLGNDHVLQIETSGYSESYKRFHFRDIQALVLCRTDAWLYQAVGWGALCCLFGLIAIVGGGPVMGWTFGSIGGLFALFLLFHLLAGPTAKCYLRTAVQTEFLGSLNRLRRARRVFGTLHPLIVAAQGTASGAAIVSEQTSPPVIATVAELPPEPVAPTAPPSTNETV